MNMLTKLVTALAVVGASVSVANAQQKTVSGTVDFKVNMPSVLVLYHWDEAGIDFQPQVEAQISGHGVEQVDAGEANVSVTTNNNTANVLALNDEALSATQFKGHDAQTVKVTLQDAWAVRSISENGVELIVETTDKAHKNDLDPTSVINVENTKVKSTEAVGVDTGIGADRIQLPSKWVPIKGDITFDLDLSGAKKSGLYASQGQTFTLKLSAK
ncbi:hypothetical protein [Moraxella sp. Pampa]|uniref:hypothetical protein n=1 Tax=Moraxella sp. Pampa TaxID=3111978 RepID=UPI002B406366|nr:hypothetical protein [Moraxella sp. Pampa]